MVLAGQSEPLAFGFGHNRGATVGAHVIKGFDLALLGVDQYHRLARLFPLHVAARLGDLIEVRGK